MTTNKKETHIIIKKSHIDQISEMFNWETDKVERAVEEFINCESILNTEDKKEFLITCMNVTTPNERNTVLPFLFERFMRDDFFHKFLGLLLVDRSIRVICKFNTYYFYKYPEIKNEVDNSNKRKTKSDPFPNLETYRIEDGLYSLYKDSETIFDDEEKECGLMINKLEFSINSVLQDKYLSYAANPESISSHYADRILNEKIQSELRESKNPENNAVIHNNILLKTVDICGPLSLKIPTIYDSFIRKSTFREKALLTIQEKEQKIKFKRISWLIYFVTQEILQQKLEKNVDRALKLAVKGYFGNEYKKKINYLRPRYYNSRKELKESDLSEQEIKLNYQLTDEINKALELIKEFKYSY